MKGEKTARRNFSMWHKKEPRTEQLIKNAIACTALSPVGYAQEIIYASDKWENDKDVHLYVHEFGDNVRVYIPTEHSAEEDRLGAQKNTSALLGASRGNQVSLAQLGEVRDLTYVDADGEERAMTVGRKALLLVSADRKTLLILSGHGPIFITGGKMRAEARGIVN